MAGHEVLDERVDGLDAIALSSRAGELRVGFAPGAGLVGYSLSHRGEELLGQRGGLKAYREQGSTFGIPLLHPWANRLAASTYSVGGRSVDLSSGAVLPEVDHGRFFRSLSSCFQVRVLATSVFVSQPRRACATASST